MEILKQQYHEANKTFDQDLCTIFYVDCNVATTRILLLVGRVLVCFNFLVEIVKGRNSEKERRGDAINPKVWFNKLVFPRRTPHLGTAADIIIIIVSFV